LRSEKRWTISGRALRRLVRRVERAMPTSRGDVIGCGTVRRSSNRNVAFGPTCSVRRFLCVSTCGRKLRALFRILLEAGAGEGWRIERIFESEGIEDELGAYNPLIPDGSNWKATLLIEYPDPTQRKTALALPKGIEDRCWVSVR
jgi:hypothetical protein